MLIPLHTHTDLYNSPHATCADIYVYICISHNCMAYTSVRTPATPSTCTSVATPVLIYVYTYIRVYICREQDLFNRRVPCGCSAVPSTSQEISPCQLFVSTRTSKTSGSLLRVRFFVSAFRILSSALYCSYTALRRVFSCPGMKIPRVAARHLPRLTSLRKP